MLTGTRRGAILERYITLDNYLHRRQKIAVKGKKEFYARLMDANDRKLLKALKEECEMYGEEIVETARRLNKRQADIP